MPSTTVGDIEMYCEEHGSGDPLLLIMGLAADSVAWMFHKKGDIVVPKSAAKEDDLMNIVLRLFGIAAARAVMIPGRSPGGGAIGEADGPLGPSSGYSERMARSISTSDIPSGNWSETPLSGSSMMVGMAYWGASKN